jgi:flagellar hook-associated protein 3 FlgL
MSGIINDIYNKVSYAMAVQTQEMSRLQEQVVTGSRINRPSDDSSAAYQIMGLSTQQRTLGNYVDNLSGAISTLEFSSTVVQDMLSNLSEAQTLLTQVTSGTYNQDARERTADEINDILEQMATLANSQYMGQSIFGGGSTISSAYQLERTNSEITGITYRGSNYSRQVELTDGLKFSLFQSGNGIFSSNDRDEPVFLGETGAKGGSGTSSVNGDTWLTVTGSPGSFAVSIDGGLSTFETDGSDTNLAVTNSLTGEVLYIDTTSIVQAGVELVRTPGTYDLFGALISIRDILRNDNGLSDIEISNLQESTFNMLKEVSGLLTQNQVVTGMRTGLLENLKNSLANQNYNIQDQIAGLQDADIAQITIDLSMTETLYQMSLSVAGKLLSVSLLDYL